MSTILLISPEPWHGHFVSKHHYALELARRGHHVLFYGPAESAKRAWLDSVPDTQARLHVLHAPKVATGLRFLPGPLRQYLEARWIRQLEKLTGRTIDIVWNFENSRFFDMRFAGDRLKIYHQVDLNQDFHSDMAASTSDISIAISAPIERRLEPVARNLIRITHGHAESVSGASAPQGLDQGFATHTVNAVLIGNLDIAYLDVPLLAQLVAEHRRVCFHFIGAYQAGKGLHAATGGATNVMFWGHQPFNVLPAFLNRADVLLVAYLADDHLEQLANPHKIMEYLASGRCVLATRTLEYEDRPDLIETASDRTDYAQRFAAIVADPATWNSAERIARRKSFALQNSYPCQLDRIEQALGPRGCLIS